MRKWRRKIVGWLDWKFFYLLECKIFLQVFTSQVSNLLLMIKELRISANDCVNCLPPRLNGEIKSL